MNSKKRAAEKAVEYIHNGMIVGLGTGSTAILVLGDMDAVSPCDRNK